MPSCFQTLKFEFLKAYLVLYQLILLPTRKKFINRQNVIKGAFCENKISNIWFVSFIHIRLPYRAGNY